MKILIFSKSSWNILNFRKNLIKTMINLGYSIYIISSLDNSANELKSMGCKIYPININNKKISPFNDFFLYLQLIKKFKLIRPNIILNFNVKPVIYGSLAARFTGVPSISMITGLGTAFIKKNWLSTIVKFLYFLSLKKSHMVFFQNNDDRDFFLHNNLIKKESTDLVPGSGINLDYFNISKYPKNNNIIFLLISRILWDKGIAEFIKASRILKNKYKNINFQLLGPIENEISSEISLKQIKLWEKEGIIEYLGYTDDVRPFIEKSHCVVLPSYREGTPKSLLEAAAMARPIITTNTVGCKEIVDHNLNGYLCKNKDFIDLSNYMEKFILLTIDEKISMGLKGRKKVEDNFNEKFVINKYLKVIKKNILL